MHIHILGICGTFMGSMALLARDLGHTVTGSDANVYPPMSTQLENAGVEIMQGYTADHLGKNGKYPTPDLIVVGNAMKRGIEAVEYMLDNAIPYISGPQFLAEHILHSRHVLAVAGTHGKTTTTTMLAWTLQFNGIDTGFLIGGVPLVNSDEPHLQKAFAHSSYLGKPTDDNELNGRGYFVIEADEYDSAFFDKRSKFVHYRPTTSILNNLEFDHADIFADLDAIQTQFHHLIRMIPSNGVIIMPSETQSLEDTIQKGCWTPIWRTTINNHNGSDWQAELIKDDGTCFKIHFTDVDGNTHTGEVNWGMSGLHNVNNALVTVAAAHNIGVSVADACTALSNFAGIKRRMELIGDVNGIQIFDDFAHHPTAITTTLDGAKKKLAGKRIWAIIEPRSNTMKMGIHRDSLASSASLADEVIWYEPENLAWGLKEVIGDTPHQQVLTATQAIIDLIVEQTQPNDAIVIMSNGGFEGIHKRLVEALQ
ncbi:UDP-N-acetylmuramate:L-alanyl-gamma-D-glutamyl-meso-diaminopimelate ligase [Psychrobacter sp. HD31]|uniref:UDP-N-acetylmuramate:L-alanyl-gamma-D-glutamyl- meso-diaminopimelate ligase n=1 Tax=Psychrobacter sp. HD31 TaxID=3112003 RepID=UPI003DA6A169